MWKMKLLFVTALVFIFNISVKAEDATHSGGTPSDRPQQTQTDKSGRLFQLISACMAGRPFPPSDNIKTPDAAGGATALPGLSADATASTESSGGGDGATIFKNTCFKCHADTEGPTKVATLLDSVQSDRMPRGSSLSPADKEQLVTYLKSRGDQK
jgi:mono/diheme cytochrome c family protein